ERQLYTVDKYFQDEEAEPSYQMAGKEITPKLLLEAIRALPEEFLHGRCTLHCAALIYRTFETHIAFQIPCD
ncbi:hypothetical protein ACTPEF_26815, partial [Clostridioides difficile]